MRRADWLSHQLPVGMTDDEFLMRFLMIFQSVSETVLHQVDTLPHTFDPAVAPDAMVRLMGQWMGVDWIDSTLDDLDQRELVRTYSDLLRWRGTSRGLRELLEQISGAPAVVEDNGGIYPEGESPRTAPHVTIRIESTGWAAADDLVRIVRAELPASVTFEMSVGPVRIWPATAVPAAPAVEAYEELH